MQANFTILWKQQSVEDCFMWKQARRFLGAHTHRKKRC